MVIGNVEVLFPAKLKKQTENSYDGFQSFRCSSEEGSLSLPAELGAGVAGVEAIEGEFCSSQVLETKADTPPLSPGPAPNGRNSSDFAGPGSLSEGPQLGLVSALSSQGSTFQSVVLPVPADQPRAGAPEAGKPLRNQRSPRWRHPRAS